MPDPADRIRVEPKAAPRAKAKWKRALAPQNRRTIAGAALAAMMIGIVINAIALQHGHRDLGFVPDATAVAAIAPPAKVAAPSPAPVQEAVAVPEPPRQTTTAAVKTPDAIADFLRAQGSDKRRLTLTAQGALAKLGFSVKPSGALDAQTRSALIAFEKSHHLAASTEITAKLVRSLKAAVAAN